jgi:hypothetical protein
MVRAAFSETELLRAAMPSADGLRERLRLLGELLPKGRLVSSTE